MLLLVLLLLLMLLLAMILSWLLLLLILLLLFTGWEDDNGKEAVNHSNNCTKIRSRVVAVAVDVVEAVVVL